MLVTLFELQVIKLSISFLESLTDEIKINLHAEIVSGNAETVSGIIENSFSDKVALDIKAESAVSKALRSKAFDIYEILIKNGFWLSKDENFQIITKYYNSDEMKDLKTIHKRCSIDPDNNYLAILLMKCKLIHSTNEDVRRNFYKLLIKVFTHLANIECISFLLKIVTFSESLKLIFDFEHDSVNTIDPTLDAGTLGISFYNSGLLLIGAKGLLGDEKELREVMGVIAHEIAHYALQMLYENDSKPYKKNDEINEAKICRIISKCRETMKVEELIKLVFNYEEKNYHAEIIVRIPHMLALYTYEGGSEILQERRRNFPELFEFYEQKVLTDLRNETQNLKIKIQIQSINKFCGSLELLEKTDFRLERKVLSDLKNDLKSFPRITVITSNIVRLTMKTIGDILFYDEEISNWVFTNISSFENSAIFKMIAETLEDCEDLNFMVECDENNFGEIENVINKFSNIAKNPKIIFVCPINVKTSPPAEKNFQYSWRHLEKTSQEVLLKTKVNFQGSLIQLSEILTPKSTGIETIELQKLFNDEKIQIGSEIAIGKLENYVHKKIFSHESHDLKNETVLLLVAPAGCGKTVILKERAKKLQQIHETMWIAYIDLKLHRKVIEKDEKMLNDFKDVKGVVKYFASTVLNLDCSSKSFFVDLYENDRVIFLFDSIDVISSSFKKLVMKLIVEVQKSSKNKFITATRPNLVKELKLEFRSVRILTIEPFTREDRNKLFDNIISSLPTQIQKDMILKNINELLLSIENGHPIMNPLILMIIAKEFTNNSSYDPNLFALFEKLSQSFAERTSECSENITEYPEIIKYYKQKALQLICHGDNKKKMLMEKCLTLESKASTEQISQVGLFYEDEQGYQNFIHHSFAYYFLAKILLEENFKDENTESLFALWRYCLTEPELKIVRKILNDEIAQIQKSIQTSHGVDLMNADLEVVTCLASEKWSNLLNFINSSSSSRVER